MSYRSVWKGFLKLALITAPVKLYAATAAADTQRFTYINPKTGNKVDFKRVDSVTGEEIAFADMVKGVEVASGKYTAVAPDEIEAVAPASVHTIEIAELVPRGGIGWLFPDALYYLAPDGVAALAAFALIREGIAAARVAAIGQLCLGSREHLVTLEAGRKVLRLSTLRYAPETRDEELVFPKLAAMAAPESLVEPVGRILASLRTEAFDPARYTDRYARGLSALVLEKISGKMVKRAPTPPPKLLDLEKAVTRSANLAKTRRRA